jgi:DnaJ-class molecular chaperone
MAKPIVAREDYLKERALQILNLRYPIESDIKSSYKRRIFEHHPDRHPETKDNPNKVAEYEKQNQGYQSII